MTIVEITEYHKNIRSTIPLNDVTELVLVIFSVSTTVIDMHLHLLSNFIYIHMYMYI